jgi:hypothetical protein
VDCRPETSNTAKAESARAFRVLRRSHALGARRAANSTKASSPGHMPHGGRVAFAYLENVGDAMMYQGRNVTDVWVLEAGQYPTRIR